jgi:hypothetical protein
MNPKLSRWIISIALFTGCAGGSPPGHPPSTAPADRVKLSDAVPLDALQSDETTANLTDKLEPPEAGQTIYFGELDSYNSDDTETPVAAIPLIALHNDQWKALPVIGPGLTNAGWKYVAAGPARHEIWGVLDTSAGETQNEFVLAHSTDGGDTFSLKTIKKPCKLATFTDFAMSRDGHGRATLTLDTDCGQYKSGLYHYDTTDDGKTWPAQPRYEPDVMLRAQSVTDDEQPDAAQSASHPVMMRIKPHRDTGLRPVLAISKSKPLPTTALQKSPPLNRR